MLTDYAYFGDVVSFDTTFGTNRESRPFGVFVGFNHFRETVIFGAVLMYDVCVCFYIPYIYTCSHDELTGF